MPSSHIKVFVVVLNYNGYGDTKNCILSLKKATYNNLNIVIVDNASPDNSGFLLKKEFPELEFIFSEKNNGYAAGMNLGIKYSLDCEADFILLTNNDVVFTPDFFEPLTKTILSNDSIGIVSPKVQYLHDRDLIYCAGADFKKLYCGGYNPFQGKPSKEFGDNLRKITFAEGSCLLVKREVFEKIGLINEEYFMYFEDLDFSERVIKYFEIYYVPQSIVYHKAGAGLKWSDFSPLYYFYYTRNRLLFFSKFNFWIKIYAVCFSILNTLAKSLILLQSYILVPSKRTKIKKSLASIWKGIWEGLQFILKIKRILH